MLEGKENREQSVQVKKYKYLRVIFDSDGRIGQEISNLVKKTLCILYNKQQSYMKK